MERPIRNLSLGAAGVLLGAWAVGWLSGRRLERPVYRPVLTYGDLEVREYAPHLEAETLVAGPFRQGLREGFRRLSRYLFGENRGVGSLATGGALGPARAHLEMTAPVRQAREDGHWRVSFPLPARFTMETVPAPVDPRIRLRQVPARRVAVLAFRGRVDAGLAESKARELAALVSRRMQRPVGPPVLAQYDPPWTPGFLRRNELQVELER